VGVETDLLFIPFVGQSVDLVGELWKTANCIWMPFGVVSGVGRGMGVLNGWRSSKGNGQFWELMSGIPLYGDFVE